MPEKKDYKGPATRSGIKPAGEKRGAGLFSILFLVAATVSLYYFYLNYLSAKTENEALAPVQSRQASKESSIEFKEPQQPIAAASNVSDSEAKAEAAFKEGNFYKAIILLKEALRDSPDSEAVKSALARSLNRAALNEYKGGNFQRSKELLLEAIDISKEQAYMENLANAQIKLHDLRGAAVTLEGISANGASRGVLKSIYVQLGNENNRSGNTAEALDFYEKAASIDPGDVSLRSTIANLKGEGDFESRMGKKSATHFLVRFEGGENATAGHLIGLLLEEAYIKVGSDLNFYPDDRIEALLYSRESFRDITRSPSWAGAIFDGRIKIPAGGITEKTSELEKVIFHEYTHAVVRRLSNGRAPTWLNEGMAQYEEGRSSAQYREQLKEAASGDKLKLRYLEGSFMGLSSSGAQAAYLVSLSATEYMIREFGVSSVRRVFEGLAKGQSLDGAMQSAIYMSYDEFEKSWTESLKR